jgi:hypothetical protein
MTYAYIPIDYPKQPYTDQDFWLDIKSKYYERGALHWESWTIRKNKFLEATNTRNGPFKFLKEGAWYWTEEVKTVAPKLIDYVEGLPFSNICLVNIATNWRAVPPHHDLRPNIASFPSIQSGENVPAINPTWYDLNVTAQVRQHCLENEPAHYRVLLTGPRTFGFYMIINGEKHYINMPEDTDTFAFNAAEIKHGADLVDFPKMLLIIHGWLDPIKHNEFIKRSELRYPGYPTI